MSLSMKVARIQTQGSGRVMPGIGDPGFFGDVFGKVFDFGKKLIGGSPIGAAATTIFQRPPPITVQGPSILPILPFQQTPLGVPPAPTIGQRLKVAGQALIPGGVEPFGMNGNGMGCPTGHHPNKSDYFLKNGTFIQKGSRCVKNRRRNPLNPRAMDRAISRIVSGKKASSRMGRITIRKSCK